MVRSLGPAKGTKAAEALAQCLPPWLVVATRSLEKNQINRSLPYQNREDSVTPGKTWMLKVAGGNKDEVGHAQR